MATRRLLNRSGNLCSECLHAQRTFATFTHRPLRTRSIDGRARMYQGSRRSFFWPSSTSGITATVSPFASSGSGQAAWESLDMLPQISSDLLPLFFALLLAINDEDKPQTNPNHKLFTVEPISDKGLGAFASRDIARGEVIITERPLFVWPTSLDTERARELIQELTPSARQAFYGLANAAEPGATLDPILAIRATNAFAVELPELPRKLVPAALLKDSPTTASFIFPRVARINHSCSPNSDHSIDWSTLKMSVYATTPIKQGEEVCIEYTSGLVQLTRSQRREILKRDFGFVCRCGICGQNEDAVHKSDGRRREINAIVDALGAGEMSRKDMWGALERIEYLLDQEGYKAMPEFNNPRISSAYVGFREIKQRKAASEA